MKTSALIYTIFIALAFNYAEALKILAIFPVMGKSHHILGHSLMLGLAERGHEVVYITCYPEEIPSELNYRQVILTGLLDQQTGKYNNLFKVVSNSLLRQTLFLINYAEETARKFYENPNVKNLLASNETFDVVIVEQFFLEATKGLAWHYNAPLIVFSTIGANTWFNGLMGNPSPPSYIPEALSGFSSDMSFIERVQNSLLRVYVECLLNFKVYPAHNKIFHNYFPNAPHLTDIIYNTSIALINSDVSFNQPVPKVPNMIDIGGFHVQRSKPLPKELQIYLDGAKEGVVYFSMGTHLKSSQLPDATKEWLLRVFSNLKLKVLWKFEEELPGRPVNVEIKKWLPQSDVLAHPNVKLFITHGGLLSTTESVYHGLPILALPVFGDQRLNAMRAAQNGIGLFIDYKNLTESYFQECVNEILTNRRYAEKAKEMSKILHDKPMAQMDTANFWVEYVVRHQGAPHLRVASLKLNIFQYLLLDVICFVIIVTISLSLIIILLLKKIFGRRACSEKIKTQ